MARNVTVSVVGGVNKTVQDVSTVRQALSAVDLDSAGYTCLVNGSSATDSSTLKDFDFVSASMKVKGAN